MNKPDIRQMIDTARANASRPESDTAAVDTERTQPTSLAALTLFGLQLHSHIYAGTVPPEVVAKRRARNRQARRARRGNTAAIARQARLARGRARTQRLGRFGYADLDPFNRRVVGQ